MSEVQKRFIEEARSYLHVSPDESDDNIERQIRFAYTEIVGWCGEFTLENNRGRGLVLEYVRFLYNGQGEYFRPSYSDSLASFSWELFELDEEGDD